MDRFNIKKYNATCVSVGSRKTYGQPNLDGELPGDPNAELRNPSYYQWVHKGGLFVGNAPPNSGDLSGTARIQVYMASYLTFTEPVWSSFMCIYLGVGGSFTSAPTLSLSTPSPSDPNLAVAASLTTWGNAWDLGSATLKSDLVINNNLAVGEYACFQSPGYSAKMLVHLKNEQSAIDSGLGYWRYFSNLTYATASGLITSADAQPRLWVVDRLNKVAIPQ